MIAVPIALALFGYWVLYAGLKGSSLADAYRCTPQQGQTPGDQSGKPGTVGFGPGGAPPGTIIAPTNKSCKPQPGDTVLPALPWDNGKHLILRPSKPGIWGQITSYLVGPC